MTKFVPLFAGFLLTAATSSAQWVNQPVAFASPSSLALHLDVVDANTVWIASDTDGNYTAPQLARTTDGGQTWAVSTLPLRTVHREIVTGLSAVSASAAWLISVPVDSVGSRVLRTSNGGQSWTSSGNPFTSPTSYALLVHFFSATNGVVVGKALTTGGGFEVFRTTDAGLSWTPATTPATLPNEVVDVRPTAVGNRLWFVTNAGRVFRSPDQGQTWAVSQLPGAPEPTGLAFRDAQNGLVSVLNEFSTNHALYRTTDGGQTWATVTYAGPLHGISLSAVPGTTQFVSMGGDLDNGDQGSSYSRDNGQTWVALESTVNHLYAEFVSPTVGWSGGFRIQGGNPAGNGVNKFTATTLSMRQEKGLQAAVQVVPNPADAGQTTLRVARPFSALAQVRVLDATGRLVGQYTWTGSIPLALDLSRQGTGLYLVTVESTQGQAQHKVLVR